ncbi:MAG: GMC family oxidoreductase [Gemmatimonadetes bacterium]|nr:GMC family oxidoreductase [Gemmatimonadota bacterium]
MRQRTFPQNEAVDFVIVGSGAAGGVVAKELASAGFSVVVLEQGPWRQNADFQHHDEYATWMRFELQGLPRDFPQTFRNSENADAQLQTLPPPLLYARGVGGSSIHFTANYWRFQPIDFNERSRLGPISGTGFADWPISYEELEPHYTKVDWEIGVSGAPGTFDPPRSRPYPVPPLPVKSSGVLLERGARALGWHADPAPMAILSQPYEGRPACGHCGYCIGYGCEFGAKSSTLVTMIPRAIETGNCEVRAEATVYRIETDDAGRATGVLYWDATGAEHRQRARAVVLCANGAETTRLLLLSESSRFPDGLANSSGLVGKHLMFNGQTAAFGVFEHPLNEYKSVQVTRIVWDFYQSDPARGFYGGGGFDARLSLGPLLFALFGMPPEAPLWGAGFKTALREMFPRAVEIACHSTSLPVETNSISLDPTVKDKWGRPALRVTYHDHDDDIRMMQFLQDRANELLDAAGARRKWSFPAASQTAGAHLLGTCRMGNDPATSVVTRDHRSHDVPNLFICDGSSFVTSGRGQPTMTIQALAFRAGDRLADLARRGEIAAAG